MLFSVDNVQHEQVRNVINTIKITKKTSGIYSVIVLTIVSTIDYIDDNI